MAGDDVERYERERRFHDEHYHDHAGRSAADRFYSITGASRSRYRELVMGAGAGRRVLEYGCGTGSLAFDLARAGADVIGVDISPTAIERAAATAASEGLDIDFRVMNAEALALPDGGVDLVCGSGILHHLDLDRAMAQVARVLAPGGEAVFFEPLGHNPLINLYRRRTPEMRSADEHPLVMSDLDAFRRCFDVVEMEPYHLAALAAVPFRRTRAFRTLTRVLDRVDAALFRTTIGRRMAWTAVIRCRGPRAPGPES